MDFFFFRAVLLAECKLTYKEDSGPGGKRSYTTEVKGANLYVHIYMDIHLRAHLHTYIHTYIHTCIHAHMLTYIRA